jgi:hypothetical protein
MKKKTQKSLLSVLVVATVATTAAATLFTNSSVSTAAASSETTRFEMVDGASIRFSEPFGLRFIAEIGGQEYADLKTKLQKQFKHNRDAYTEAQGEFIPKCVKAARAKIAAVPLTLKIEYLKSLLSWI